jgi:hypothetical protein
MPNNFQYAQLEAKWENTGYSLWYGQDAYQSGVQQLQQACQSILDLPRS